MSKFELDDLDLSAEPDPLEVRASRARLSPARDSRKDVGEPSTDLALPERRKNTFAVACLVLGSVVVLSALVLGLRVALEDASSDASSTRLAPTSAPMTAAPSTAGATTTAPATAASISAPEQREIAAEEEWVRGASLIASVIADECGERYLSDLELGHELKRWEVAVIIVMESELELTRSELERLRDEEDLPFSDVPEDACWAGAVNLLAHHGIARGSGTDRPTFLPGDPVTWSQVEKFLGRASDLGAFELTVDASAALAGFIDDDRQGVTKGIVDLLLGRPIPLNSLRDCWESHLYEFELSPNYELKRWEVAMMIFLESELEWPTEPHFPFEDVPEDLPEGACRAGAVNVLHYYDVTRGYDTDPPTFGPNNLVTRNQIKKLLDNAFKRSTFEPSVDASEVLQDFVEIDREGRVTKEEMDLLLSRVIVQWEER